MPLSGAVVHVLSTFSAASFMPKFMCSIPSCKEFAA
jgi:hypothetical protein